MQNTALSFTERSGHLGATGSDHWSWHPLATSEGGQSHILHCPEGAGVTVKQYTSGCHSVDVQCECHFVYVTLSKFISWFNFIDITLKISLCWCHLVDVSLLMSVCCCQSVDVTLLTIGYVNEQQLYFLFEGMTSKDMTKKTWTFLSELPTWSLKTCCTLSAGSATLYLVGSALYNWQIANKFNVIKEVVRCNRNF